MRSVAVVVQACAAPGRPGWDEVRAAIESSDIGMNYEVLFHPLGRTISDHVLASLDRLYESGAELCIRLEDDVDVNANILHNLRSWPMVDDARFGAGWLFDPGGSAWQPSDRAAGRASTAGRWHTGPWVYTQGVVFRRQDLPRIRTGCAQWFAEHPQYQQRIDEAIARACIADGRQLAVHAPALIEHRIDMPSQLGHHHASLRSSTTRGAFLKHWRRDTSLCHAAP